MAKERVVFDFTDEEVRKEIVGFKSYTWYNYYDLIKEGRKWYNVEEKEDKVKVSIVTKEDNEYDCIYYKKTIKEIETLVNNKEPVNLRHCYIKDFNILEIQNDKEYEIINFDAKDSFWDGNVSFFGTKFGGGDVIFEGTQFGVGDVRFDEAQFGEGNVIFDSTYFGEGYTSFDSTYFGEGDVRFDSAQFGEGAVSFSSAQFGEGDVSFRGAEADRVRFDGVNFLSYEDLRFESVNRLEIKDCILEKTLKVSGIHKKSSLSLKDTVNIGQICFEDNSKHVVKALGRNIKQAFKDVVSVLFKRDKKDKNKRDKKIVIKRRINLVKEWLAEKEKYKKSITMIKENYHNLGDYEGEDRA